MRAKVFVNLVHGFVSERFVDKSFYSFGRQIDAYIGEPFPVAVVTENGGHVLPFAEALFDIIGVGYHKPSLQFLTTYGHELDSLEEIVAEPSVELPFYMLYFFKVFLREGRREVVSYDVSPVSNDMVHDDVFNVGEDVKQT